MDTSENYIQNQFCSYEIALKLKELGFDEKCFGYYGNKYGEVELFSEFVLDHSKNIFYTQSRTETSAPLWQQVIDWLFSKKLLYLYDPRKNKVELEKEILECLKKLEYIEQQI